MEIQNVIIIGGGAAGLSAALYLARAGLAPLIFAGSPPGGQLMLTSEVENFPGRESILGGELIDVIRKQATKFGGIIIDENVLEINLNKSEILNPKSETNLKFENSNIISNFELRASKLYSTKSIIIATGAKALWMGLDSETRLRGKGVSACATCDAFFFKNKIVAVIGGGDSALEEALTLTKFASKVYIVHRRAEFKASKIMQKRVLEHEKIEIVWNAAVEEIIGEKKVEGIKIKAVGVGRERPVQEIKLDGVFVAIGHRPDTDLFKGQIELDQKGYVLTTAMYALEKLKAESSKLKDMKFDVGYQTMTSVSGVFGAGDCVDHVYKQASTAAGMGVQAALDAERYLEKT